MPERHTFSENVCEAKPVRRRRGTRVFPIIFLIIAAGIGLSGQTKATKRTVQDASSAPAPSVQLGGYYALVIGNNNYRYVPKLKTAVSDANAVAELLRGRYGFTTEVLLDVTRNRILTALNEYRRKLPEDSNLLIYYAGHGHHDPDTDKAYWLPIDAQKDNNENWISADDITSDVKAIPSQHVLIISDSCYSGVLTRSAEITINPMERGAYIAKMVKSKSRSLMSSGGDEPVADSGSPGHSVFAAAIIESLQQMEEDRFTAADLFQRFIQPGVAGRSDQVPQYSLIRNSGHAFGDFVFWRRGSGATASAGSDAGTDAGTKVPAQSLVSAPVKPHSERANTAEPSADEQIERLQALAQQSNAPEVGSNTQSNSAKYGAQASPPAVGQQQGGAPANLSVTPNTQQFAVVHYGGTDTTQNCMGWMTVEAGMLRYRAVQGSHGMHSYDFPAAAVKEVKKNALFLSALQAFHVRLTSGEVYNFSVFDPNTKTFLNADSLLIAAHAGLGK